MLQELLSDLRNGIVSSSYQRAKELNDLALFILKKKELAQEEISDLDDLLRICNILCHDTDNSLLPIEDGVYDLLLEKYKTYNSSFQVGADVITMKAAMKPAIIFEEEPVTKQAIIYDEELGKKLEERFFLEDIMYPDLRWRASDFDTQNNQPVYYTEISKRRLDTIHNHPELVGTLDKCKFVTCKEAIDRGVINDSNVKILERDFFADHIKNGIIDPNKVYTMVGELKYDGVSVEADCREYVESARSRGDTGIGQATDYTPILAGYRFPHMLPIDDHRSIGVKFEAIIQNDDLRKFNELRGYTYKNGRTAIVGLTGSSDAARYRDLITLVPLQVEESLFSSDVIQSNRIAEIEFLNDYFTSHGCPIRYVVITGTYIELLYQIKLFLEDAEFARPYIPFMYDGIVVSYVDKEIRDRLGRENSINKYSMAVKFNPLKKQTTFREYKYTVGQDGSITPMIYYDPVEFYGTIHPKSSGHSFKRFKELNLAKGDIINVEYVNDVMPYVSKPLLNELNNMNTNLPEDFIELCPECGSELMISESGKSVRCTNRKCGGRALARMVNMFTKLNLAEFGDETVKKIGSNHIHEICEIYKNHQFQSYGFGPGESALLEDQIKIFLTNPIKDHDLFGSLGFTNLASKSWQLVFAKIPVTEFIQRMESKDEIAKITVDLLNIKGLGKVSVETIMSEYLYFMPDIDYCMKNCNIVSTFGTVLNKQIRATGFRNRGLFAQLRELGHDADDDGSVTKSTDILLVPFAGYNSGSKLTKISEKCQIVPVNDFIDNMDQYL